jgi:hypothetical protein
MTEKQEIRAKSLEIAVSILGGSPDSRLDKYLTLADGIADYINTSPPGVAPKGSTVGQAPIPGI